MVAFNHLKSLKYRNNWCNDTNNKGKMRTFVQCFNMFCDMIDQIIDFNTDKRTFYRWIKNN